MQNTATKIVKKLQEKGFLAYFVGGCVRDMILKKEPTDIDIATNALPEEIESLFEKTYAIGKNFGVILIKENEYHFEIASFRSDSGYSDGRRPNSISFTNPEEDALRRDFTINGIFWNPITNEYLDFVEGISDLKRGLLRFIGDPETRIKEDFLRILRAIRFKNRFKLSYKNDTKIALKKHSSLIIDVSSERLQEELSKMLLHPSRMKAFRDLFELGILYKLFPEIKNLAKTHQSSSHHSEGNVLEHLFLCLDKVEHNHEKELYWATFFHDFGKAETISYEGTRIKFPLHAEKSEEIFKKYAKILSFSKFSTIKISWLIRHHHLFDQFDDMKLSTKLEYFDSPFFLDLIALAKADILGSIPENYKSQNKALQQLHLIEENYHFAHTNKLIPSSQKEIITGKEIMEITKKPASPEIGKLKKIIREKQIEGELQTKEKAIDFLKKL